MNDILHALYDGEIYPSEQIVPHSAEYHAQMEKLNGALDRWEAALSEEAYERLLELLDLHTEISCMVEEESFRYGFALGALLLENIHTLQEVLLS